MIAHLKTHQEKSCPVCDETFSTNYNLKLHRKTHHDNNISTTKKQKTLPKRKFKRALNVFASTLIHPEEEFAFDFESFKNSIKTNIQTTLHDEISSQGAIKWYGIVKIQFEKTTVDGDYETLEAYFRSHVHTQLTPDNLEENLGEAFCKISENIDMFLKTGSGWVLKKIIHFELCVMKYTPLRGSSYLKLPKKLENKHAILNIQNFDDEKCFIWCLLAHKLNIDFSKNPRRVTHYEPYENDINMGNVKCPVRWQEIPIIERLNNLRINVFLYEDNEVCPLYISKKTNEDCINLLLLENEDGRTHYTLIRNFSRLLSYTTKYEGLSFFCFRCLHRFVRKDLLEKHQEYCQEHAIQKINMPKIEDSILKFTAIHQQHPMPFVIYADFESLIVPLPTNTPPSSNISYTIKTAQHIPCGYAYIIISQNGEIYKQVQCYRGEDAVSHFIKAIIKEKEEIKEKLLNAKPLALTDEEEEIFQNQNICHICNKEISVHEKRRDHCHIYGEFRGPAHNICNLNYKLPKKIPVIFHNLKNYDSHHIMTELGKFKEYDISVIPTTMEKYITFKIHKQDCPVQLVFLDSLQFLLYSLDKLVKNLNEDDFKILKTFIPPNMSLDLFTRKGVYPYSYVTSFEVFRETQLPPQSSFFNDLTEEPISESDYAHAQHVWEKCNIQNLGEYHDFYVKLDVVLLADVFENFRSLCKKYYDIDPTHNYTSPGLSWQACLKMTEVELELLTDINMLLFIEKGVRGGICQISQRYAEANNKYLKNFDESKEKSFIIYLDCNNLYGAAMSEYLPYGDFQWIDPSYFTEETIHLISDTNCYGYILEVDLHYPPELHSFHNEYPLAPERITVNENMLSPYMKELLKDTKYSTVPKLILNLNEKKRYVLHYRNLKLYLQLGLQLKTVHKVLKFKQAPWLKKYIDFNTEKRKMSKSNFEKDFFKLLNNSIYGKTIENLRKRRNIELCQNERRAKRLTDSPAIKHFKIFNEDLVAVERVKQSVLMNRPTYVGFTILELSKVIMYQFHYQHIKQIFKENASLLFTDTDSLTYHIKTEDLFEDMKKYEDFYDFSDYPKNHILYSEKNKKILGKFKDEMKGTAISQFVGLKPKMYSILTDTEEKKTAKGVSRIIVQKRLKHENYYNCLFRLKTNHHQQQKRIAQENHMLFTIQQNKISLGCFDDKRYWKDDGITSFAYGHSNISNP